MGEINFDGDQCPVLGVDGRYIVTQGVYNVSFLLSFFLSFLFLYFGLLGCGV
jgi:hypothetical protein